MPKQSDRAPGGETPRFPEIPPPPVYRGRDYDFLLQGIFDIQKNLGKLDQAVLTITDQQKEQGKKLDALSHKVYAAIVVILFVGAVLTFFSKFTNDWLFHAVSK